MKYDGEQCEDCDQFYGEHGMVWRAQDNLWNEIGWGDAGLLCPGCFAKRRFANGEHTFFVAVNRETFLSLMRPE